MATYCIFSAGLSISLIGVLTIVGWLTGTPVLTTWIAGSTPMAPATAVLSTAMGASLMLCSTNKRTGDCVWGIVLSLFSLAGSATVLALRGSRMYIRSEFLGLAVSGSVDGAPIGYMSPITAACFAAASIALFAQVVSRVDRKVRLTTALATSVAVVATGVISLLTSLLGYPILAGSVHVPVAVSSSVVMIALGIGLAAMGIRLSDRSSRPDRSHDRSWRPLVSAFIAVAAFTAVASYAFYRQEETEIQGEFNTRLDRITLVAAADVGPVTAAQTAAGFAVHTRRLPNSDWSLMSEADGNELEGALWERLRWVMTLAALLLTSAGVTLALVWHSHRAARFEERAALAEAVRLQAHRERQLLERSPAVLYTLRVQGHDFLPTDMSANVERILGYTVAEALDRGWFPKHLFPDDREAALAAPAALATADELVNEFRFVRKDGSVVWVSNQMTVTRREAGQPAEITGAWHDVTARKEAKLRSERLTQLYSALSRCNFAVAHSSSEADLFSQVCAAAASVSGLTTAWIGLTDPATLRVTAVAAHGAGAHEISEINVSAADVPAGRGPTGVAIREGRPCWIFDSRVTPSTALWARWIDSYGWLAGGSLPLSCEGKIVGALTIYGTSGGAFDEESQRLFTEMAASVSFALDNLARERRRTAGEEALRESEGRYRAVFANSNVPRLVIDPDDGRIVDANDASAAFYGWSQQALRRKHLLDITTMDAGNVETRMSAIRGGNDQTFESRHRVASGEIRDVEVFSSSIKVAGKSLVLASIFDVTERNRADLALRATLQEREALLKEVHHRVKNNLQVISSLLRLERERHQDTTVRSAMDEMQLRILSMALLHETLYRSTDLARVDLSVYLADLANQVFRSAAPSTGRISLGMNLASVFVDMDHAIPCGLLVNEVLSNCLKHGFPNGRTGTITIDLIAVHGGSSYLLQISDDGVGLPEDFDRRQTSSLGVHLIKVLARQLSASLTINGKLGTTFSITFAPTPPSL